MAARSLAHLLLPASISASLVLAGCGGGGVEDVDAGATPRDAGGLTDAFVANVDAWVDPTVDAGSDVDASADVDAWIDPGIDAGSTSTVDGGGASVSPDVAGPYTVTMSTTPITGATIVARVPTLAPGERAPLVLFKHGFQLSSSNYAVLLERIASHGFFVLAVDTRGSANNIAERDAITHAIDWALADAPFAASVDGAHIAVMGHSRGGKVAVLAAAADTRITAALLLDPVNGCGPGAPYSATCPDATVAAAAIAVPVGVMGETNDGAGGFMPCAPTALNYDTIYDALSRSPWKVEWTYADAVHMTFTDDGGGTFGIFCATPPTNSDVLRAQIHTQAVAFARYHLRGDSAMAPWLTGASVPAGVTTVGP